jgi:transcriptional regulator GlxA family with amidase domain
MAETKKQFLLGILLFDDVEVLDFCGPFEVFSIAGERFGGIFTVKTIADKKLITARNGLKVVPDYIIGDGNIPDLNVLLVPGGLGTIQSSKNPLFINWIKSVEPKLDYLLTVCTGVSLLGQAGLLDNLEITTHRQAFEFVQPDCPKSRMCKCRRFTDNGRIMTSAGISAGIDLSFYFVKKTFGADTANGVADMMEYDWKNLDYPACTCKW